VEQEQYFYFTSDTIDSKGLESRYLLQTKQVLIALVFELGKVQKF